MKCNHCKTEWSISVFGNSAPTYCPVCGHSVSSPTVKHLSSLEETLQVIVRDYGIKQLQDGARAIAFFADLAPNLRKEKILLQHLIQCNGNTMLIAALQKSPAEQELCIKQLITRLMEDLFISQSAADLICYSFWNAITVVRENAKEITPEDLYQNGCAVEQTNPAEARRMITQSAEGGCVQAELKLAKWYRDGYVVNRDPQKAFYWYREAAQAGDSDAQCNLGWCYATGFGCIRNAVSAFDYFKKAADAGITAAQYNLAQCYEKGNGTSKNFAQAASFYMKAAKVDHAKAQYHVGRCYERGLGFSQDIDLAIFWYKKAALNGIVEAQYEMGLCYEQGKGVSKDADIAYFWYKKAVNNGHQASKDRLKQLSK